MNGAPDELSRIAGHELAALATEVRRLAARDAIRDLVARYCHCVRTRAYDDIVDMYVPDGVFDMPTNMAEGGVRMGREAIARTFADHGDAMDPHPFTHNHVIDLLDANHATGHVYVEFRQGRDDLRISHIGVYDDEYVQRDGQWKFKRRTLVTQMVPRG